MRAASEQPLLDVVSTLEQIETIALGSGIRDRARLRKRYGQ